MDVEKCLRSLVANSWPKERISYWTCEGELTVEQHLQIIHLARVHHQVQLQSRWKIVNEVYTTCNFCVIEPESFEDVVKEITWKKEMEEEIRMIEKNKTWELFDKSGNKKVIIQ